MDCLSLSILMLLQAGVDLPVWEVPQRDYGELLSVPDQNGDGIDEIVVARQYASWNGAGLAGAVLMHDGLTGHRVLGTGGANANARFGQQVELQDVDADGRPELVVQSQSSVTVLNLSTLQRRWSVLSGGANPVWAQFDPDPELEMLLGNSLYEGETGSQIWSGKISDTVDLDGDGDLEVVFRDSSYSGGVKNQGRIRAFRGEDRQLIWERLGGVQDRRLGSNATFAYLDQSPGLDFYQVSGDSIEAFAGSTGDSIWEISALRRWAPDDFAADLDSDGLDEVIVTDRHAGDKRGMIAVLDGQTGHQRAVIWGENPRDALGFRPLLVDIDANGITELVCILGDTEYFSTNYGLTLLQAGKARWTWLAPPTQDEGIQQRILPFHSNRDGVLDFVVTVGKKSLHVIDGKTGLERWSASYPSGGYEVVDFNRDGLDEIFLVTRRGMASLRSGFDGEVLRSMPVGSFQTFDDPWFLFDLTGDGVPEFVYDTSWVVRVADIAAGEVLLDLPQSGPRGESTALLVSDLNGDGVGDLVTQTGDSLEAWSIPIAKQPGLVSSVSSLSQSQGGRVEFVVDFGARRAGWRYQVLASATGSGPTTLDGVEVPLSRDSWFRATVWGQYPFGVFRATGRLDLEGQARPFVDVNPGLLDASLVGTVVQFACLVADGPGVIHASSMAVSISIDP